VIESGAPAPPAGGTADSLDLVTCFVKVIIPFLGGMLYFTNPRGTTMGCAGLGVRSPLERLGNGEFYLGSYSNSLAGFRAADPQQRRKHEIGTSNPTGRAG